jgi:hypothetical protein
MDENRDLFGQADALLKRHNAPPESGEIPTLTDIVEAPSPHADPATAGDLSQDVFNRVMAQVEGRLASELERRLVQHLEGEVHVAVASALGDLRQDIANAIGDAISEALKRRSVK